MGDYLVVVVILSVLFPLALGMLFVAGAAVRDTLSFERFSLYRCHRCWHIWSRLQAAAPALLRVVLLGAIGGFVCGTIVLAFTALIGRSGYTGNEQFWDPAFAAWLASHTAAPAGALLAEMAYYIWLRPLAHREFWRVVHAATVGTLIGGLIGAIGGPPGAFLMAIAGYILACDWAVQHSAVGRR